MFYHNNSLVQMMSCTLVSTQFLELVQTGPTLLFSCRTSFHLRQFSGTRMTSGFLLMAFTERLPTPLAQFDGMAFGLVVPNFLISEMDVLGAQGAWLHGNRNSRKGLDLRIYDAALTLPCKDCTRLSISQTSFCCNSLQLHMCYSLE